MEALKDNDGFPILGIDGWGMFRGRVIHRIAEDYFEAAPNTPECEYMTREELLAAPEE